MRLPKVIGYRGASAYAPENTLEGIRVVADLGIPWVHASIKLTRDSVPVLFHDDLLDRTTNGFGPIAAMSWSDLQDLEAGSWFSEGFSGIRVPSLEEALDQIVDLNLGLLMELRPCPGREVETAEAALDVLSRVWDDPASLLISSSQMVSLETAMDMAPEWGRVVVFDDGVREDWEGYAQHLDVSGFQLDAARTTRDEVEVLCDFGKSVLACPVSDPQKARTLLSWGVDAVISDTPDVIWTSLPRAVS